MPLDRLKAWLIFHQARAPEPAAPLPTPAQPSRLSLDLEEREPLTPQSALSFDQSDFSCQLPFFAANIDIADDAAPHPPCFLLTDDDTRVKPNANTKTAAPPLDKRLSSLFYTFFLSPTASTSSLVSSVWSSHPSCGSRETQTTMPGPTLEASSYGAFAHSTGSYFSNPFSNANDRPESARSGQSSQSVNTNPLFTRWARRHQQHHHHRQNGQPFQQNHSNGPGRGAPESKPGSSSSLDVKRPSHSRSASIKKRQSQSGVPQMTRQEFEALPVAIQRKYFSTLERLRFAQESGIVDGISQHYDDISRFRRRKPRQDRSVSDHIPRQPHFSPPHSSPSYTGLPDTLQRKEFSREKQVVLARHLRASVILDAADEAIYKINRRASRNLTPNADACSPSSSLKQNSMDSHGGVKSATKQATVKDVPQSFYESFRWLEEEDDLDLRLFLDDYHANLREDVPSPTKEQRPSFRRHLSISKIPFSRNSVSISRPGTKDATTPTSPLHSPAGSASQSFGHTKRKSRALSLITPKHAPHESITAFDPAAAHYQDPEARLKLRVYLASPQKFDEAIEFGFPSTDMYSGGPVLGQDNGISQERHTKQKSESSSPHMRSFLVDDDDDDDEEMDTDEKMSFRSDQPSMADPDSPKTPQMFENKPSAIRPHRVGVVDPTFLRDAGSHAAENGGYAQVPASSREMTLRMTLTRPDLRAREDQIYGWQQKNGQQQHIQRSSTMMPLSMESSAVYIGDGMPKDSMDRVSAGIDHWSANPGDKGVMKRIWNRMRRV
ncbi:hypothetical protein B0H63DRAFT_439789 [Podospora didyma]|uniref:Mucin n=1 Tax=Podospora didyma TaxID=330526 RepID=A0AAE0N7R1_9PEZI|nr:hypothetical protein B0H63DRAFT_439789 [Podospora didyma]